MIPHDFQFQQLCYVATFIAFEYTCLSSFPLFPLAVYLTKLPYWQGAMRGSYICAGYYCEDNDCEISFFVFFFFPIQLY